MTSEPGLNEMAVPSGEQARVAVDRAGLEVLDRAACLELLGRTRHGRVGITVGALPLILPVRFAVDEEERIIVSTGIGTVLERATAGRVVAFQADGVDDNQREWSVAVVGVASHLTDAADLQKAMALPLPRWLPTEPRQFVALATQRLSGRRSLR